MNYKKIFAAAAALTLLSGFTGCGKESGDSSGDTQIPAVSDSAATSDKAESTKAVSTASNGEKSDDKSAATTAKKESSDAKSTTSKAGGNSSAKTTAKPSSGSSAATTAVQSSGGSGGTEPPAEEKSYTAEITFGGSASVKGENASVDGKTVRISAGGDYVIKGKAADAQIYVATVSEEKITLILDGVDIACSDGPAININEAKRCTIKLASGSQNYLRDGGTDKINDGVIFSNDTLRFKGDGGYLEINSGNAHGIASDDDIIFEGGRYNITSVKSGVFAHDDITVNGGELTVFGGTNGLKSKGTVNINGGVSVISGGSKEEKSSIYASAAFYYTGGKVFAAGNKVTAPASAPNPYVVASFDPPASAQSEVRLYLDGGEQVCFRPHNDFRCVLMLTPDIAEGKSFSANVNGSDSEEFQIGGGQNLFQF